MPLPYLLRGSKCHNCLLKLSNSLGRGGSNTLQYKANPHSSIQSIRYESSWRRQTKRLAMPIAPSMAPNKSSASSPGSQSSHIIFNPPPSVPNVYHTPLKFLPLGDPRRKLFESGPSMYNLPSINPSSSSSSSSQSSSSNTSNPRNSINRSPISLPGTALNETLHTYPNALGPRIPSTKPLPPALKDSRGRRHAPTSGEEVDDNNRVTRVPLTQEQVDDIRRLRLADPTRWTRQALARRFGCSDFLVSVIQRNEEAGAAHGRRVEETRSRFGPGKKAALRDRLRRKELWGRDA